MSTSHHPQQINNNMVTSGSGDSRQNLTGSASSGIASHSSIGPPAPPLKASSVMIGSKPTPISVPPLHFLIMDAPRQQNLHLYIKECRKHHVTDIVRVCDPTYLGGELQSAGIQLHEMPYDDGHSPPKELLERWLRLVDERFFHQKHNANGTGSPAATSAEESADGTVTPAPSTPPNPTIAVHCVAGLGRAPVLVAIALIEFVPMDPVEAVRLIRRYRRGAINEKQLNYLESYQRWYKRPGAGNSCCVVS
uniref:Tyrosine specific protein phosphatases domain-containing protein n=1 Tax=Helicotheca tamesis TaxID=374047 RepID=A0A7S2MQ22_9STRA|mmetsp:Transcript_19702/g.27047  ORF Transcript_19702/g.27047 Transcript_19702/m.27047 type:complete len:250 (+) Transcript_19702:632-1381(+)